MYIGIGAVVVIVIIVVIVLALRRQRVRMQVLLAEDQAVQELVALGAGQALADRVHARRLHSGPAAPPAAGGAADMDSPRTVPPPAVLQHCQVRRRRFSEGMRAEPGRGPVTVTTVVPGLMRTGSHLQARFTGQAGKEFTWFALRASLPLISMDAQRAARQLISAVRQREPEIILTRPSRSSPVSPGSRPG